MCLPNDAHDASASLLITAYTAYKIGTGQMNIDYFEDTGSQHVKLLLKLQLI